MTVTSISGLPLRHLRRGKVREVYAVDAERLLIVATDRVSAFDVVMREPVAFKGAVLTQLSAWWLRQFDGEIAHHLISADVAEIVREVPVLASHASAIAGRAMLCRRADVFPVECVVRGYLTGSAWKEYKTLGTLAGEPLPPGLREADRLPEPIFTPATKALEGHDENIDRERAAQLVGSERLAEVERTALDLYEFACEHARARGVLIADTKFEFGLDEDGRLVLGDEAFTPDSSRFWPADGYEPGRGQPSFDKQYVRDYCETLGWDKAPPGPELPDEVVHGTRARYVEAFERLTGIPFERYLGDPTVVTA